MTLFIFPLYEWRILENAHNKEFILENCKKSLKNYPLYLKFLNKKIWKIREFSNNFCLQNLYKQNSNSRNDIFYKKYLVYRFTYTWQMFYSEKCNSLIRFCFVLFKFIHTGKLYFIYLNDDYNLSDIYIFVIQVLIRFCGKCNLCDKFYFSHIRNLYSGKLYIFRLVSAIIISQMCVSTAANYCNR